MKIMSFSFDPSDYVSEKKKFDPMPKGKYCVRIVEFTAYDKVSAAGHSYQGYDAKFQVCKGEHTGRFVWSSIIHTHPNSQATEIGRGVLSQIHRSLGLEGPCTGESLSDVVGKCLLAGLKIEAGKNGYPDKNAVSFFDVCDEPCCDEGGQDAGEVDIDDLW